MPYIHPWTLGQKVIFRFISSLFTLFIFPFPFNYIPPFSWLFEYYSQFIRFLTQQVGSYLLGISQPISRAVTGSGDQLYNWVNAFTYLLLAFLITIIWTILDRKRPSYRIFFKWLLLFVSYYLMMQMLIYGLIKVFYIQFSPLSMEQLFQTYGYSSPLRLMWSFMGASQTYSVFAGLLEVAAAVLLIFRKTRVIGGLISFGVMLNVFVMNMSYDVPVKLFSFQYMLMGLLLVLADYRRLLAVFVQSKNEIPATVYQPVFQKRRNRNLLIAFQALFVVFLAIVQIWSGWMGQKKYGISRPKPVLYGVYNVTKFVKNGQAIPPLVTDTIRWRRLLIDYPKWVSVMHMDDRYQRYLVKTDTIKKQMIFSLRKDTVNKYTMQYKRMGKDLKLTGVLKQDTLDITFQYYPLTNFNVLKRDFHWVSETPRNGYKDD
ncbi:MAG TPA: hypothetical protein DCS93_04770 [Microscillaceae bacterium]|nr:hypothetical protein [Microscillaceae bacterium]